jgi:hypothetical protein
VPAAAAALDEPSQPAPVQEQDQEASSGDRFKGLKVFVAGATGGTGREVVTALRERGVPVVALARDAAAAVRKLPEVGEGLEIVEGDGEWPAL